MRIAIVGAHLEAHTTLETLDPGRLLDLCDDAAAPIDFSCRSATCGSCLVEVLDGVDLLAPAGEIERDTLLRLGRRAPLDRLACVARLDGPHPRRSLVLRAAPPRRCGAHGP